MLIITLFLIIEIGVASLLVNFPNKAPSASRKVLGETVLLAEDTSSTDTTPSADTPPPAVTPPTDTAPADASPAPADQTPPPETAPTPEPAPTNQAPVPDNQPSTTQQSTPPATEQTPIEPAATSESKPAEETAFPAPEQVASKTAEAPILNTDDITTNPDKVDTGSRQEAEKEDQTLSTISDPEQKATALTAFASDKVSDIDRFTHEQDFNSTAFANTRLSDQIDQLKTLSSQATNPDQPDIRQKLSDLCQQTNITLRTTQEVVPEDMEQDLEITRGQCLGY